MTAADLGKRLLAEVEEVGFDEVGLNVVEAVATFAN